MVEILLSLVPLAAAGAVSLWPWLGIHDHTTDGLFLTLTEAVMFLLFHVAADNGVNTQPCPHFRGESSRVIIRIHLCLAQSCHFQRLKNKCVPGKHTVVPEKGMPRIGGKVFLARREIGRDVDFSPEPV